MSAQNRDPRLVRLLDGGITAPGFQAEADCSSLALKTARQAGLPTGTASFDYIASCDDITD